MQETTWVPVKNYEGYYEINEQGEVRSLYKRNLQNLIPQKKDRGGYYALRLSKNGKVTPKWIHRLLAETFIPNVASKREVNHKDGNKLNNALNNLEWVTHSENMLHAYKTGLIKLKTKRVVNHCTGEEYSSVKEAANVYGLKPGTLRNYLNGNIKTNPTCLAYKVAA